MSTDQSINLLPACGIMDGEWHSLTPDGLEVVVQRRGKLWLVRRGHLHATNRNLDVALLHALRADPETSAHSAEADYPAWIRTIADKIAASGLDNLLASRDEGEAHRSG
jgi:hypothetical protein